MAHQEILLLKPIEGLGGEGDLVKVRAGYARNYLLPRSFALPVTQANRKHIEALKVRRVEREAKELEGARELATRLKTVSLAFAVKTGEGGKMFGSITQGDLHTKLEEQGHKIEKKRIHLAGGHVKTLGKHEATIKLHPDVSVDITFEIVSENPIEEAKPAEAPGDKDKRPRRERKERSGPTGPTGMPKTGVEALLDELGPAPEASKPGAEDGSHKPKKRVRQERSKKSGDDE